MLSAVRYHTHSQWQLMTNQKVVTNWWQPHTLMQLTQVCMSRIDIDF